MDTLPTLAPDDAAPPPRAARPPRRRHPVRLLAVAAVFVIALFALPALLDSYWLQIMTAVAIYSIVTLGLGLLIGRVGMVSLCQFVLMAVGAWVALRLELRHVAPVPDARAHRRRHHRCGRRADRPAGAPSVGPVPGADHADGRRRHHRRC